MLDDQVARSVEAAIARRSHKPVFLPDPEEIRERCLMVQRGEFGGSPWSNEEFLRRSLMSPQRGGGLKVAEAEEARADCLTRVVRTMDLGSPD